jgi:hypothetical protein
MAANIFTGATNNNWNDASNWSLLAIPTASDTNIATFNIASPNCTVNGGARVCNHIDFTGYLNTITMTNTITVSGNVTFGVGMLIAGASTLIINAASTMTSNGVVWPNNLTITGNVTYTLADNWTVNGTLTFGNSGNSVMNGNIMNAKGNFTHGTSGAGSGTTHIKINGTGAQTWTATTTTIRNNITFYIIREL